MDFFASQPARPWKALTLLLLLALLPLLAEADGLLRQQLSRPIDVDPDDAASVAEADGGEVLRMRWRLSGFFGALAGLFVPNKGEALLTFVPEAERQTVIQLLTTAKSRSGDYLLYGASIDEQSGATSAVWSSQLFRGKRKEREQEVVQPDVIDYSSVIYRLRWSPPDAPTRVEIWSHGKTYPARIEPLGPSVRRLDGEKIPVRGYAVRGVKVDGERSFEDDIVVYFARDASSTPIEIVGKRGFVKVRIRFVESLGIPRNPHAAS